jgi:hypothetical protein
MANRGNAGHRGYKMSKVASITPAGDHIEVMLECTHRYHWNWKPDKYDTRTPEQYAQDIQSGENPVVIGKTRLRCNQHR